MRRWRQSLGGGRLATASSASDSTSTQYCRRSALYKLLCMYVCKLIGHKQEAPALVDGLTADSVNQHYTRISTDRHRLP